MNQGPQLSVPVERQRTSSPVFHPGDLLIPRAGYPVLCEVVIVEPQGLLRIRGMDWDPGYSAQVLAEEMRPVSTILAGK